MNIWWVKSRSTKKNKKNTTQAYLRWYENRKTMTKAERLKLIQISIQYVIPRLKQVEEVTDEMPREFQIEVIDSLSKYSDKELDKAIKN